MALNLENLDERIRYFMLEELEKDLTEGKLYISRFLSEEGKREYEGFLREAIERGDDASLIRKLARPGMMILTYQKRKPKGGFITADVPITAPETLGEGELNRFYARGLCRRAIDEGIKELEIYRAKQVRNPRPISQTMIGKIIEPKSLLEDLRTHPGVEPALHLPPGPNSGLSVRLIKR